MAHMTNNSRTALLIAACGLATASAAAQPLNTLFSDNFDSFQRFANFEEGVLTGPTQSFADAFFGDANDSNLGGTDFDGTWTQNGWTQTFAVQGVGTAEWEGFSVARLDFWFTADDQLRSEFTRASGAIAVADPDEWDDFDPLGLDPDTVAFYDTTLTSPLINIAGVTANTAVLRFDSSWRPECCDDGDQTNNQTAIVNVEFFNGPASLGSTQVLFWQSNSGLPDFKPDSTNEAVTINLSNPANATGMRVTFEMRDARNDWWWAIDNVEVAGQGGTPQLPPGPFDLIADTFNADTTPFIDWSLSLNAVSYDVIFANDAAFTDIAFQTTTTNTDFTPAGGALQAGSYYLKVIARNSLGTFERSTRIGLDNACPADLDANGSLNSSDFLKYLNLYSSGC